MTTIHEETRAALDRARQMVTASIDVAQVPDGHPVERKVHAAFIDLEEAFDAMRIVGRTASSLDDPGPAVRVVISRDMRRWPTTAGKPTQEAVIPRGGRNASRIATSPKPLMTKRFAGRRMISSREFLAALEDAALVETHFSRNDSYSMVQLAGT